MTLYTCEWPNCAHYCNVDESTPPCRAEHENKVAELLPMTCQHELVTSTFKTGPICTQCKEPLVSLLWPISRNTPAGSILWEMMNKNE